LAAARTAVLGLAALLGFLACFACGRGGLPVETKAGADDVGDGVSTVTNMDGDPDKEFSDGPAGAYEQKPTVLKF
jgi:hypothetical protein